MKRHLKRPKPFRILKKRIAVFCEGAVVEPVYFNQFRNPAVTVKTFPGTGGNNSLRLVSEAIGEKVRLKKEFDEYWVVFDKDGTANEDFNRSLKLANDNGLFAAYSIQAFEFWLILHFSFRIGSIDRREYDDILSDQLGFRYEKTKSCLLKVFDKLYPRIDDAIKNAKRIYSDFSPHTNPAAEESSTLVHLLVEKIRK